MGREVHRVLLSGARVVGFGTAPARASMFHTRSGTPGAFTISRNKGELPLSPRQAGLPVADHRADARRGALLVFAVVGLVFAPGAVGVVIRALWNALKERDGTIAAMQEKRAIEQVEGTKQVPHGDLGIGRNHGVGRALGRHRRTDADAGRAPAPGPRSHRRHQEPHGRARAGLQARGCTTVQAMLAWAGLEAVPAIHDDAVHAALNVKAAIMAGHARMLRLQRAGDHVVVVVALASEVWRILTGTRGMSRGS